LETADQFDDCIEIASSEQSFDSSQRGRGVSAFRVSDRYHLELNRATGGRRDTIRIPRQPVGQRAADVTESEEADPKSRRHQQVTGSALVSELAPAVAKWTA